MGSRMKLRGPSGLGVEDEVRTLVASMAILLKRSLESSRWLNQGILIPFSICRGPYCDLRYIP